MNTQHMHIESRLQAAGYRLTQVRRLVLQILEQARVPLTPQALQAALADAGRTVNKTTVYRELQFLQDRELVRSIQFDGKQQYFELHSADHHHHIRCLQCGAIADVLLPHELRAATEHIQDQTHFEVLDHSLEFIGICENCQA